MNGALIEPLLGQTIKSEGHTYGFSWEGLSVDGGPHRGFLNVDARELVGIMRGAMKESLEPDAERAVALVSSSLGLNPFEGVEAERTVQGVIGGSGPLSRANAAMIREAREGYDRMSQELGLEIDKAEARGSTLLVRAELPPELITRLAVGRVAAFIGRGYDSWAVITPQPNHGDVATVAAALEEEARAHRLEALTVHSGTTSSLIERSEVSPAAALAYAAFLAPEVMLNRLEREPGLRDVLRGEISVPSAIVADAADHTLGQLAQRDRVHQRSNERSSVDRDR